MKNFVVPLLIGVLVGALLMYLYQQTMQDAPPPEKSGELLLSDEELAIEESNRKAFSDSLKRNDREVPRDRGTRINIGTVNAMTQKYVNLRNLLHTTGPAQGYFLGAGMAFGIDQIDSLLKDIERENIEILRNNAPRDREITGIRGLLAIKRGPFNGGTSDYLDIILVPARLNGESVFEWEYIGTLTGGPPPLDDSNPCPDACP